MKRYRLIGAAAILTTTIAGAFTFWGAYDGAQDAGNQIIRPQAAGQTTGEGKAGKYKITQGGKEDVYRERFNWDGIQDGNGKTGAGKPTAGTSEQGTAAATQPATNSAIQPGPGSERPGKEATERDLRGGGPGIRSGGSDNRHLLGTFKLTAYTAGHESTGKRPGSKYYGQVAISGSKLADFQPVYAEEGVTIAADWRVIPPGTVVWIEGIGRRVVQDKGGGVKGNHIDVFMEDLDQALEFGRSRADVYIVN